MMELGQLIYCFRFKEAGFRNLISLGSSAAGSKEGNIGFATCEQGHDAYWPPLSFCKITVHQLLEARKETSDLPLVNKTMMHIGRHSEIPFENHLVMQTWEVDHGTVTYLERLDNGQRINISRLNLGGSGIGSFTDRIRDAFLGGSPFCHPLQ
ncbi:hypothetical protein L1987_24075 [Smallanthus sonchifolius]|uniref:Uncharacterized protein n=1 Tax=Smallanthus sonchifolius TaxID=185202 RepID=A0ACB9IJ76_9ASTR|nr:hypothetical protein L1987_24075 [Smallanthus sonchifolius]